MVAGLVSCVVHRIQLSQELEVRSFLVTVSVSNYPRTCPEDCLTIMFLVFSYVLCCMDVCT